MSAWESIKDTVASIAPVAGSLLGGPSGGAVGSLIASAIGVGNDPGEVAKAIQADPQAALKLKQFEMDHAKEMRRLTLETETARMTEINTTMRAELDHDGWFKSGWRPGLGWVFSFSLAGLAIALIGAVFREPSIVGDPEFSGTLIWLFVVMGSALGLNVKQRSNDKAIKSGVVNAGLIDKIFGKKG